MFLDEIVIFFQYTPWELIHLEITPQCLLYNPAPCLTSALMRKDTHLYTFTLFTEPLDRLPSQFSLLVFPLEHSLQSESLLDL